MFAIETRAAVMPTVNEFEELTGYATADQDREAFEIGWEIGREDAIDGDGCTPCGALPAQRAGYLFGYVGELVPAEAYARWNRAGRAA